MNLDPRSTKTLYEQIYEYIRDEIRKGTLKCGERLPSTRLLASHLDVSRSTAQLAYEQLLSEGYIEAIPCKGYFVSDGSTVSTGYSTGEDGADSRAGTQYISL